MLAKGPEPLNHEDMGAIFARASREEYRRMFNCKLRDEVHRKYGADGTLMDVHDTVRRPRPG